MARRLNRQLTTDNGQLTLNICHLYPDLMDTYGDKGNIIAIQKRCEWRRIKTTLSTISVNDHLNPQKYDIYFFGGGQDRNQAIVGPDLQKKSKTLKAAINGGSVLLSICGGYQLLQKYFKTKTGEIIEGISLFDADTQASNDRMIQNLLIEINPEVQKEISDSYPLTTNNELLTNRLLRGVKQRGNLKQEVDSFASLRMTDGVKYLIGFENHSGKTYLGKSLKPLGKVIVGAGNNGGDGTEGAVYKNAFGCYLHGSLLPKNPHFADYLISKSLERRYGEIKLKPLDDSIEWQAHKSAIKRTRSSS